MGTVTLLRVYPIKGLPPVDVTEATVLPSGALTFDRRWALVDERGRFVNGKNYGDIHRLQSNYNLGAGQVTIGGRTYALDSDGGAIAAACSEILGTACSWTENVEHGFPDDLDSPGPTLVSEASVAAVASWFGFALDATRRRFRANIEIGGTDPFWEDRLYGGSVLAGDVRLDVVNPCARCVVPSRDATTGEVTPAFQKRFAEQRRTHLPADASVAPFNHYYRFTANTRVVSAEAGKTIRIGDRVTI